MQSLDMRPLFSRRSVFLMFACIISSSECFSETADGRMSRRASVEAERLSSSVEFLLSLELWLAEGSLCSGGMLTSSSSSWLREDPDWNDVIALRNDTDVAVARGLAVMRVVGGGVVALGVLVRGVEVPCVALVGPGTLVMTVSSMTSVVLRVASGCNPPELDGTGSDDKPAGSIPARYAWPLEGPFDFVGLLLSIGTIVRDRRRRHTERAQRAAVGVFVNDYPFVRKLRTAKLEQVASFVFLQVVRAERCLLVDVCRS